MSIFGVREFYGKDMPEYREKTHKESGVTLGWDDLVILQKSKSGLFSRNNLTDFYHHVSGMDHSTPSAFPAYFVELLSRQEQPNWRSATSNYEIIKGICHVFNSFTQSDVIISVEKNGRTTFTTNNQEISPNVELVKQIRYSSALRYYRNSLLITHDLFGNSFWDTPCLRILNDTQKLDISDFEYILNNHPPCYELYEGIAKGLIFSLEKDSIKEFLERNDAKYPDVVKHLISIIPRSKFFNFLLPTFEKHLELFSDDMITTFYIVKNYLEEFRLQEVSKYFPLLQSTIGEEPLSGIACALYCIYSGKIDDAIYYLNGVAYSNKWQNKFIPFRRYEYTTPKQVLDTTPSPEEQSLYKCPLYGTQFEYFSAISFLCESVGYDHFCELANNFFQAKQQIKKSQEKQGILSTEYHQCYDNYLETDVINLLYDPGVSFEPNAGEIKLFTPNKYFKDTVALVNKCFYDRRSIISGLAAKENIAVEIELALKLRDPQFFHHVSDKLLEKPVSGIYLLFMLRAISLGMVKKPSIILSIEPICTSQNEKNAIDWSIPFFKKLINLSL